MIYAIDFGTSNSLLAAARPEGLVPPIPLDPEALDPTILRSILFFPNMNEVFYGSRAIQEFTERDMQGRLLRSIKRFLPVRSFIGTFVENRPINLEDIIAIFLAEMRRRANLHFDKDITSAVIGRPARFAEDNSDDQFAQYRLEKAARIAGFKDIVFFPEPLAAAYSLLEKMKESKIVFVADFGGGTSDFTVVKMTPPSQAEVLGIGGVTVAGDALDGAVMRGKISPYFGADVTYRVPFGSNVMKMPTLLMENISAPAEISVLRARDTMEFFKNLKQWSVGPEDRKKIDRLFCLIEDQIGFQLFEEIEKTKRSLSSASQAKFSFPYPGVDLDLDLSRTEFEALICSKAEIIVKSMDDTLKQAGVTPSQVDFVFSTGGTAKVPLLQNALIERFGAEKIQERNHFHSIVEGLSAKAASLL